MYNTFQQHLLDIKSKFAMLTNVLVNNIGYACIDINKLKQDVEIISNYIEILQRYNYVGLSSFAWKITFSGDTSMSGGSYEHGFIINGNNGIVDQSGVFTSVTLNTTPTYRALIFYNLLSDYDNTKQYNIHTIVDGPDLYIYSNSIGLDNCTITIDELNPGFVLTTSQTDLKTDEDFEVDFNINCLKLSSISDIVDHIYEIFDNNSTIMNNLSTSTVSPVVNPTTINPQFSATIYVVDGDTTVTLPIVMPINTYNIFGTVDDGLGTQALCGFSNKTTTTFIVHSPLTGILTYFIS